MKKRVLLPLLFGVLAILFTMTMRVTGPAARTQVYFGIRRQWAAHWPLEEGKRLPVLLSPWFQPFTPVWMQVEPHIRMQLDPYDVVSQTILETGGWELPSWRALEKHLQPGATFVDVGAHIGYYSLKAASVVGPEGHVIAIEPNPQTLPKLRQNLDASGARVVTVEPVACSDSEATLELFAAAANNTGETSLSRTNASQEGAIAASYKVRARALDEILQDAHVPRVDAIKVDVEGAEFLVLKGAQRSLDRFHPVLLIEVLDSQLRAMGTSAAELRSLLGAHGYVARGQYGYNIEFDPQITSAQAFERVRHP